MYYFLQVYRLLPPGGNPIAVYKCHIILYHIIYRMVSYHISYHVISYIIPYLVISYTAVQSIVVTCG